ncbi:hypothetical protein NE237_005983 [Protea cynaroides]|uniref:Uncharacterized protein n=1 Tax=Protea cynaroides TaxID=273540 RepID=A0A9Q0QV43_9MAGN|nr:hypothetical protein NE237_005983 [Protea cynaroides]
MKISGRTQLPVVLYSKTLYPKVRLRKDVALVGKRSGPATPLLRWKFDDADSSVPNDKKPESARKGRRKMKNAEDNPVSSRKLAAAIWQLQLPEVTAASGDRRGQEKKFS